MYFNKVISVSTWAAGVCVLIALAKPVPLAAQEDQEHSRTHYKYKLVDLGTFGGPSSVFNAGSPPLSKVLSNRGMAVGAADTAILDPYVPNCFITECFVAHGFEFQNGVLKDLGALPGVNTSFPVAINERGLIVGISENGAIDPLTSFPAIDPVIWRDGKISNLGTFGGTQGAAFGVNDHGQVIGVALNTVADSFGSGFVFAPATTQAHAFLWQDGVMQDLGTLGGPDSAAFFLNERGEVTGPSLINSTVNAATGLPTQDPFLWVPCDRDGHDWDDCTNDPASTKTGKMLDLGSLGGTFGSPSYLNEMGQVAGNSNLAGDKMQHPFLWTSPGPMRDLGTLGGNDGIAYWANDTGEVVGYSDLPGSGTQRHHGFLWKDGVMTDLGTVDGDPCSVALSINSRGQIVGTSTTCTEYLHAFISDNGGPMTDLNSLVRPGSGLTIREGDYINARGEIAGKGLLTTGDIHAILLIPCDKDHPGVQGCDYDPVDLDALAAGATTSTASSPTTTNLRAIPSKFGHDIQK